uniref:RNA exonuclease 2 n=1 Tax=Haplochromis burtoni TaxID=8153 RepID=A0A3Q2W9B6_HAPBU
MPVCSRSSAWVLATFSKSLFALSLGKAALSRPGSPLLAPAAGQASTRGSMTATGMSQRMVWVDLEVSHVVGTVSGLTQAVRDSKITLEQAEYEFLSFVRQHTPPGQCPLAGNSVHADKRFLDKYMPQFMYHLHYRIIDVSTIKELSRRWFPEEYKMVPHKKATHRALEDIRESIKELQYYRANIFKASEKNCTIVENGGSSVS